MIIREKQVKINLKKQFQQKCEKVINNSRGTKNNFKKARKTKFKRKIITENDSKRTNKFLQER